MFDINRTLCLLQVIYCIENGLPLLLENLPVEIDAVLDPVIGKATMKKGRNIVMKIGDNEVEYDSRFRLYLQTKLSNPHYKPEINAQATLVNFCVTEKGLEDQLLALVSERSMRGPYNTSIGQIVNASCCRIRIFIPTIPWRCFTVPLNTPPPPLSGGGA